MDIVKPIVLIAGPNGSGKSSIIEALHYACYLRSFRTSNARDLIAKEHSSFFIKLSIDAHQVNNSIQVGFGNNKRLVKIDQQTVHSYKDLMRYYKVITTHEDDLAVIKGAPESRRLFIDQALLLHDHDIITRFRLYKQVLSNRNALLQNNNRFDYDVYVSWTEQLWHHTQYLQSCRKKLLFDLQQQLQPLLEQWNIEQISLEYDAKQKSSSFASCAEFLAYNTNLYEQEKIMKRSMFGIHVDDIDIKFKNRSSRTFASRGQQKLTLLLLKIAQIKLLLNRQEKVVLLLDDFMTDFDNKRAQELMSMLATLPIQLIFTCPLEKGFAENYLANYQAQSIFLTS